MEEWMAIKVMRAAHEVGLQKLGDLGRAIAKLKEGEKTEAIEAFEAIGRFFEEDLRMHFRHEEQALFPVLAKIIGRRGPIEAMLEEHDSIWRAIDAFNEMVPELKLADASAQSKLIPVAERVVTHIRWLLTSHIQKEDFMLFPMAEKMLDQAGKREVDENVDTLESVYGAKA